MKTLIFLIFVILVISGIVWQMRKSQAKADLAKRKATELLRQRQKEAVTPQEDVIWPVVIRPVKGQASAAGSNPGNNEKDAVSDEPSMTAIEFEPTEQKVS